MATTRSTSPRLLDLWEVLGRVATSELDLESGLGSAVEAIVRSTGAVFAEAWVEREALGLDLVARCVRRAGTSDQPSISAGSGIAGIAFMHDDPTVADRDRNTHALDHERHRHGAAELTQVVGVPLRARGVAVGVVSLGLEHHSELHSAGIADLAGPLSILGPFIELQRDAGGRDRQRVAPDIHQLAMVGLLTSSLIHDVNNAFTVILGCVDGIDESAGELTDELAQLRAVSTQGARLAGTFLRTVAPTADTDRATDLADALAELEPAIHLIAGKSIRLELRVDGPLEKARVELAQLEQAILNLTANARDAMSEGGTLTIGVAPLERGMSPVYPGTRITVTDTGIGMDEEALSHLFTPFFTTKPHGSGLGLQSVKRMVEESAGEIRVSSTVGHGTRFEIDLQTAAPDDRA